LCTDHSATSLPQAEQEAFHASHAELGAYLLGLWGFADPVIEALLLQTHPSSFPGSAKTPLTYVHLARALGPPIPLVGPAPHNERLALDQDYAHRLALSGLIEAAPALLSEERP